MRQKQDPMVYASALMLLNAACNAYDASLLEPSRVSAGANAAGREGDCSGRSERCNGHDDDCDGEVDEEIGSDCDFDHAIGRCAGGACVLDRCEDRYYNCNGTAADGCESAEQKVSCNECGRRCDGASGDGGKDPTSVQSIDRDQNDTDAGQTQDEDGGVCDAEPGPERCDDRDNDCDGKIDETAECSCFRAHVTGQTAECDRCACDQCPMEVATCIANDNAGWTSRCIALVQCYGRANQSGDCPDGDCFDDGRGPCAGSALDASLWNMRVGCGVDPIATPCGAASQLRTACLETKCASSCRF